MLFLYLAQFIFLVSWACQISQKTLRVLLPESYIVNFDQENYLEEIGPLLDLNPLFLVNQLDRNEFLVGLFFVNKFFNSLNKSRVKLKYEEELEKLRCICDDPNLKKNVLVAVRTFLYSHAILLDEKLPESAQRIISTTLDFFDRTFQERFAPGISLETNFEVQSLSDLISLYNSKLEINPKKLASNSHVDRSDPKLEPYFFRPLREFAKEIYCGNKFKVDNVPFQTWNIILDNTKDQIKFIQQKSAGDFAYFVSNWGLASDSMATVGGNYTFKDFFTLFLRVSSFGKLPEIPASSSWEEKLVQNCYLQHLSIFLKHLKFLERVCKEKRLIDWIARNLIKSISYFHKFLDEIGITLSKTKFYVNQKIPLLILLECCKIIENLKQSHSLAKILPVRSAILKLPAYCKLDFSDSYVLDIKLSFKLRCIVSQATFDLIDRFFSRPHSDFTMYMMNVYFPIRELLVTLLKQNDLQSSKVELISAYLGILAQFLFYRRRLITFYFEGNPSGIESFNLREREISLLASLAKNLPGGIQREYLIKYLTTLQRENFESNRPLYNSFLALSNLKEGEQI